MILGIQGTRGFNDYAVFLRAMGTAMSMLSEEDKELTILSAGPMNINEFAMEFSNVSERSLKARGIKIKFRKVPPTWMESNVTSLNYFAFFSKPKEPVSRIVDLADAKDVEVGVYRY